LTSNDTIELFASLAKIVQYAHEQGVYHHDIKPENIVHTASRAVLIDFGSAKIKDVNYTPEQKEILYSLITPDFAAPEQFRFKACAQSDVWQLMKSFAAVLTGINFSYRALVPRVVEKESAEHTKHVQVFLDQGLGYDRSAEFTQVVTSSFAINPKDRPRFDEIVAVFETVCKEREVTVLS